MLFSSACIGLDYLLSELLLIIEFLLCSTTARMFLRISRNTVIFTRNMGGADKTCSNCTIHGYAISFDGITGEIQPP